MWIKLYMSNRVITKTIPGVIPVSKLYEPTALPNWYFHGDYITILRERCPQIFVRDIRVKPSNKYL